MKGSLALAALILSLQISCPQAMAVTWFDSSVRPDGVGDNGSSSSVYVAPAEDGTQVVYGTPQEADVVGDGDFYDSGD